jgi:inosine/xanthosine triphosphate pyrophosphatase family protein
MAELTDEEKDRISHRGRALRALRELLEAPAPT